MSAQREIFTMTRVGELEVPRGPDTLADGTPLRPTSLDGEPPPTALNLEKYRRWRTSSAGATAFPEVERRVLALARSGARVIEVNSIFAAVRRGPPPVSMNNTLRSFVSRELLATHPFLRGVLRVRRRQVRPCDAAT